MTVSIATRKSWGARYADGDIDLYGLAEDVFAHHSVTTQLPPTASVADEQEQMRAIESVGQSRFGTGISYNVIVFPSGRPYQGVSFNRRGTHTGGLNSVVRSICFAGNYETNQPTPAQLATAAAIYAEGKGKWWRSDAPLRGHRDVSQTACPGKNIYAQLPAIKAGRITVQEDDMFTDSDRTLLDQLHSKLLRKEADGSQPPGDIVELQRRDLIVSRRTEGDVNTLVAANQTQAAAMKVQAAAIDTLSKSVGVDPALVIAAVERATHEAVRDALPTSVTIPLEG